MMRSQFIAYSLAIVVCAGAAALAPVGEGDFDLSWHTIDGGGGGSSTGGGFNLAGTIGQHDADATSMTGGPFMLTGGFLAGVGAAPGTPCPADFDDSGDVGVKDLLFLLGTWGPCPKNGDCLADLVVDGVVGVKDLLFLLGVWGPCP